MTPRPRARLTGIALLLALGGGLVLGWVQQIHIHDSRAYCLGTEDVYQDAGPRFAALVVWIFRVAMYGAILPALAATALLITRRSAGVRRAVAVAAFVVVLAGVLFITDYAFFNGIEFYADYNGFTRTAVERCPLNQPPWWPNWIPVR